MHIQCWLQPYYGIGEGLRRAASGSSSGQGGVVLTLAPCENIPNQKRGIEIVLIISALGKCLDVHDLQMTGSGAPMQTEA